jgi:hypothetical protein
MDQSLENRIRERAYEIWAAHGYVHGQADQHWLAAEREISQRPANPHHTRKYVGANTAAQCGRVINYFCSRGGYLRY